MSAIIKIDNLSKKYVIGHQKGPGYETLRDVVSEKFSGLGRMFSGKGIQHRQVSEEFWALKDVSLEVQQGDRIGIIGRNGAGKSTLLKILSRITEPSSGSVSIRGRMASLLEVGTGFHPELTGRENIFLNGAVLGMTRSEIKSRFEEIVAFSEVEKFLDTPVKRYSSGMVVRLAFSVAAHLEPEILIVDEVLAVGDAQFQKKCLGKMNEAGQDGKTVLFVSHNMTALKSLCTRAVWIQDGSIVEIGDTEPVVSDYLQNGRELTMHRTWSTLDDDPGHNGIRLHSAKISFPGEPGGENIDVTTPVDMEFEFWNLVPDARLNFSVVLYDNQDICIFNTGSGAKSYPTGKVRGVCHIPGNLLNDGIYRVRLLIVKDQSVALVDIDGVMTFEVHDVARAGAWYGKWIGAVRPKLDWDVSITAQGSISDGC